MCLLFFHFCIYLIATFGWEQFDHPPYSPDLAPRDFHVFLHLKTFLDGRWFHNEVKEAVNMWFASHAASFYDAGIQKLVLCYNKCLNNGGKCRKVAYGMYIKWQYKWFGNKFLFFFFNSPSELTFWITYVKSHVKTESLLQEFLKQFCE
jgi:hypothetical protein